MATYNVIRKMTEAERKERNLPPGTLYYMHVKTCKTLEEAERLMQVTPHSYARKVPSR